MDIEKKNVLRLCSFYVSDWHLITMLLPYVNRKIDEGTKIATILENDIQENVKTLVSRLNLKDEGKILNINWTNKNNKIEEIIKNNIGNEILIIVNGSKEYIKNANEKINKYLEKNEEKLIKTNTRLKIADCFEIVEFNGSIVEILDSHDKILNTSGEKEINEVFEDYNRKEKIS